MRRTILFEAKYVEGVKNAWEHWGYDVYEPKQPLSGMRLEKIIQELTIWKKQKQVSYVFSFNFCPALAEACNKQEIDYITWEVDCPQFALWSKTAEYQGNRIFAFDYKQYQMVAARGTVNVHYLPLSTDVDSFEKCIQSDGRKSEKRYGSEVVFVGNLYNDAKHNLYDQITYLPSYVEGYLNALMQVQKKLWGVDLLSDSINGEVWSIIKQYVKMELGDKYVNGAYEVKFGSILGQKIAQMERMEVCCYLARNFNFDLYTKCDTSFDSAIKNKGYADYLTEMPLIFHYSKINIHITSRSITSGIPLRVLDVLACGGFLLTNYQPEIAEYFVDGEELVMYDSFEDMYEKIRYYLVHEEERKKIAKAGYQKVKEQFNFKVGIGNIVKTLEQYEV